MSLENHFLTYQTLHGGLAIVNGADHKIGTLGFVAQSDDGKPWIVSCYHVLYPSKRQLQAGERELIYQPSQSRSPAAIAEITNDKTDQALDVAAARVIFGLASNRVLHLGKLNAPSVAVPGMRVLKSGAKSGVTEGVVLGITDSEILIGKSETIAEGYELTNEGDSGALWVSADTLSPIGIHFEGNLAGAEWSKARPIQLTLNALKLKMLPP